VTSTLASQATPAVGRALAPAISRSLGLAPDSCLLPNKALSFISLGDGSVNNSHFLSAVNFAAYAEHRSYKCPVLFGISDNGLCISLKGYGWLNQFTSNLGLPVYRCDGRDLASIFKTTKAASEYVRRRGKPGVIVYENIPRRFGHAATDRQSAYLKPEEMKAIEFENPLAFACAQAVEENIVTYQELSDMWSLTKTLVQESFEEASQEVKLQQKGVEFLVDRNHAVFDKNKSSTLLRSSSMPTLQQVHGTEDSDTGGGGGGRKAVMRKQMNSAIAETLEENPNFMYLGEDVEHGGYYLVTENLAKNFPK
jgi:2-oxoisovalerate dehydrogenase E1 component